MQKYWCWPLLALCWLPVELSAQILTGKITDADGRGLSYASVWVEDLRLGSASNLDGEYQIQLPLGTHRITIKYLGYQAKTVSTEIRAGRQTLNITLTEEVFALEQVKVTGDMEDPAFTIMRRAIAKADFHRNQVDAYTVDVYLKGSGRLKGVPWLFRKRILRELEKEGMDTATAFVAESVSEVSYERPNTYHEVVKSVFTLGNDFESSPNTFIQASFYEPEMANAISPLSPKAFAYYSFEYQGFFSEGDQVINKIRVIPRSKGDHVFEGMIYIVDQDWAIHSLDLTTELLGIRFELNHIFEPIEPHVWMPVNQVYDVSGKVFGFSFEGQYLANFGEYDITLNPDLDYSFDVVDSKLEREKAMALDRKARKEKLREEQLLGISTQEEITPKTLRRMIREYERQEREERTDTLVDVVSVQSQVVDSLANTRSQAYWAELRPVPLTQYEVKGYAYLAEQEDAEVSEADLDSLTPDTIQLTFGPDGTSLDTGRKRKFKLHHLATGESYAIGDKSTLRWFGPLTQTHVNTVEGFNTEVGLRHTLKLPKRVRLQTGGFLHYGFSNELLLGRAAVEVSQRTREKDWSLELHGGTDVVQINQDEPIHERFNDATILFLEQNFMKVLLQESYGAQLKYEASDKLKWEVGFNSQRKSQMQNNWFGTLINVKDREYTSNEPINREIGSTGFSPYRTYNLDFSARTRPWLKYQISNGKRYPVRNSSPIIEVGLRQTFLDIPEGPESYFRGEIGAEHTWDLGARGILSLSVLVGKYWGDEGIPFPEFKHFAANLTPFVSADPTKTYRLLEYYRFSTAEEYLSLFSHFQFRKFFLTRFQVVRNKGWRESLFVNVLETPTSDHYAELGYSINYIYRFFRVEFVTSWQDFSYRDWGVRIGVAANLDTIFSFD